MTQPQITIRQATEQDLPTIVSLNQSLFREDGGQRDPFINTNWPQEEGYAYFTKHIRSEKSIGLLAEIDGESIGYLIGYVKDGSTVRPVAMAELESIYVQADYRSHGVGQQLVDTFFAWAKERGAKQVRVSTYATNERAIAFYQRIGFLPKSIVLECGL